MTLVRYQVGTLPSSRRRTGRLRFRFSTGAVASVKHRSLFRLLKVVHVYFIVNSSLDTGHTPELIGKSIPVLGR